MQKIKQGDEVVVITGKDKGKQSKVTKVFDDGRVQVAGINTVKKHQRGNPALGVSGGIIEKDMPIHVSNVAIYNPKTKKADRVGFKISDDGIKVRFYKSTNEAINF